MQSSPPPPPPPSQEEETLEQILAAVTTLQTGQTTLQTDIDALQVQVDAANAAATVSYYPTFKHLQVWQTRNILTMYNLLMVCSLDSLHFVSPSSAEGMMFVWFCAQANAEDTSLEALITAGRADIATGQATVESLLNKIIGEQDTAAAAEAAAASALAAIESLTTQQEAAAASIASAYTSSLESIEVLFHAAQRQVLELSFSHSCAVTVWL